MKLIENWKDGHKFYSVIAATAAFAVEVAGQIPFEALSFLPDSWRPWVVSALIAAAIAGRFISQKKPSLELIAEGDQA